MKPEDLVGYKIHEDILKFLEESFTPPRGREWALIMREAQPEWREGKNLIEVGFVHFAFSYEEDVFEILFTGHFERNSGRPFYRCVDDWEVCFNLESKVGVLATKVSDTWEEGLHELAKDVSDKMEKDLQELYEKAKVTHDVAKTFNLKM